MRRRTARATYPGATRAAPMLPYLVLLRVGFAMPRGVVPARGALLPHRFTITTHALRRRSAVCSLLHYSVGSRRPGVTWHPALWSPDFPRSACAPRDCLADSAYIVACQTTIRRTVREEVVVEFVNPFALSVGAKRRSRRALARQAFRLRLLRKLRSTRTDIEPVGCSAVAWMQPRRGGIRAGATIPDCASLHPGYRNWLQSPK